jgi:hypothetical protein
MSTTARLPPATLAADDEEADPPGEPQKERAHEEHAQAEPVAEDDGQPPRVLEPAVVSSRCHPDTPTRTDRFARTVSVEKLWRRTSTRPVWVPDACRCCPGGNATSASGMRSRPSPRISRVPWRSTPMLGTVTR